jgi:mannose-6-phosphate isomerase-like protein (cupin superfamily)
LRLSVKNSKLSAGKSIIVSDAKPLQQYKWGNECDAYVLVNEPELSVKLEQMPAGTSELMHFHAKVQQFFYVLAGEATMEIDNKIVFLKKSEGVLIKPGAVHRIMNDGNEPLRFVVTSQPGVGSDRTNID